MFTAFLNRTCPGRIAEWRRHARTRHQLMMLGGHERAGLPFSNSNPGQKPARGEMVLASPMGVALP
jgi:hypothetical protein